jgi:hypothetical protein
LLAPVVLFVYARPEHTKQTIEALAQNVLAKDTEVFIYSDAAKKDDTVDKVRMVREYIETLSQRQWFKSVNITKSETNKGLANSIISGVSEIIDQYRKVIVLEDDLVSSKDFLQYMNDALNFYENVEKIWSISGYTFNIDFPKDYKSEVYLSYRGCSWGWATWKDRWKKVDWEVSDYDQFKIDKKARKKFNRGGRDLANMLDMQMEGKIDSWAIRWCYAQYKMGMLTVYPVTSRIKNIGLDGSGTHSGITSKYDVNLNNHFQKCHFDQPDLDKRILKAFKNQYGSSYINALRNFKYFIKGLMKA